MFKAAEAEPLRTTKPTKASIGSAGAPPHIRQSLSYIPRVFGWVRPRCGWFLRFVEEDLHRPRLEKTSVARKH
ncbi:MAG: hypothetical protein QW660_07570 [Candidatus Bathyarchaeia archaeon]